MVPVSDFSGLASSICALASAVASAAIERLERCMVRLPSRGAQKIKADGTGFGALGPNAMPDSLLGILSDHPFPFGLGLLVLQMRRAGAGEDRCPGIRGSHIDDADRFKPRLRRLDPEQLRFFAGFDAAPELALGGDDQMLIERIG